MRNIDELIHSPAPRREMTEDEMNQAAYEADLARLRDFTPDADRQRWPKPVGPRWKN